LRRPGFALADDIIVKPYLLNPRVALEAIKEYERKTGFKPAAIVPVNDFVLPAGATIAAYAGAPFLADEVIVRCRDKLLMKNTLSAAGLRVARTIAVDEEVSCYEWKNEERLIFKPSTFGGSGGVKMVKNVEELKSAIADAQSLLKKYEDILYIDPRRMHLEEYLASEQEVSVEVYCTPLGATAVAVTEKMLSPPPYFAEIGHVVPYKGADCRVIVDAAERACRALGIDRGVAHAEIRMVDGVPYVVEVGARPAGGKIVDLVFRATGVDLYALHAKAYVSEFEKEFARPSSVHVAAISFMKAPPGLITAISTPTLPEQVHGIAIYKGIGEKSAPYARDFETREGHIEWQWQDGENVPDLLKITDDLAQEIFQVQGIDE